MSVSQYDIVLSTLNARYIHSAFGLRYLKANLAELEPRSVIAEFTLDARPADIVEQLFRHQPKIIGLSVYVWNVRETERVAQLIKTLAPNVLLVVGGPEVSYEQESQSLVELADHVISGWGEVSFKELAVAYLSDQPPKDKFISGRQPPLRELVMPYHLYSDEDLRSRILYVEASRGCPFKCEFCLSALDKTAWPFDLDNFLAEMERLYQRGARHFKFVDRTFNLKVKNSIRILEFFLARMSDDLFLHFEVVPDHLPAELKQLIAQFPAGTLQFEIGIQTFNPQVQARISRKQNNDKAEENIRWILDHSHAHVHTDLIFGLPGETLTSFAESFDRLYKIGPHEIQLGILKRLKGSPITRHTEEHQLVFNPEPPFNILQSRDFQFSDAQRITRFARFWDLLGNSGRFKHSLPLILADAPFARFESLSEGLFLASKQTHKISLLRLIDLVFSVASDSLLPAEQLRAALESDFAESGLKSIPRCMQKNSHQSQTSKAGRLRAASRQARH